MAGRAFLPEELEIHENRRASVAIISREVAEANNLWIGDRFNLFVFDWNGDERTEFEFEVVGIRAFLDRQMEFTNERNIPNQEDRINRIFAPYWIANEIEQLQYEKGQLSWGVQGIWPHFILSDSGEIDRFKVEALPYLSDEYFLDDYSQRFQAITNAAEFLTEIMDIMLVGALGAGTVIFTLLIILFLRERKSELGIYLALGEKKATIVFQFLSEILVIMLIGLTIGLFIGNQVSEQLTHTMIRNEFSEMQEHQHIIEVSELEFSFGFHELTPDEMLKAFDASLSNEIVALFFVASLGVVGVSSFLPIFYMVKMSPKTILTDIK